MSDRPSPPDPLDVATRTYFFKPMMSFFHGFELRAYQTARTHLTPRVLDLGCDDGTFGAMLKETLGSDTPLLGADVAIASLQRARRTKGADGQRLVGASAAALPFADATFQVVMANAVLESIETGLAESLAEVARVLAPGGTFIFTVPTDLFGEYYWITRVLVRLGFHERARAHTARMDRRMTNFNCLSFTRWSEILQQAGLEVRNVVGFLPTSLVTPWSLLACTPFRVNGFLQLVPLRSVHRAAAAVQRLLMGRTYANTPRHTPPDECGYILIEAGRPRS